MLKNLTKPAFLVAFLLAIFVIKEVVMVIMTLVRVELYIPAPWLPHAPYLVLAFLIFPIVAWLFVKLFRQRTVILSLACSSIFLVVHVIFVYYSKGGSDLYVIIANAGLAISFVLWAIIFSRLESNRAL